MGFCSRCGVETEQPITFAKTVREIGRASDLFDAEKLHDILVMTIDVEDLCPACAAFQGKEVPAEIRDRVEYYVGLMQHSVDEHLPVGAASTPEAKPPAKEEKTPDVLLELVEEILSEIGVED